MLEFLEGHQQPVPKWLTQITRRQVLAGPGPWMDRILKEAIVYPGSGLDGSVLRQFEKVAHVFLYLDFGVALDQIKQALSVDGGEGMGLSGYRVVAMAEFDPEPFLAGSTVQAPQPPADSQCHRYGLWVVLNRPDSGGRVALMVLGAEAISAISALYPAAPPKGLVVQDHAFNPNPWGGWERLTAFGDQHWAVPPEWLVLGSGRSRFGHPQGRYVDLGEDHAVESEHRDRRSIYRLRQPRRDPRAGRGSLV